jgi:hypothetical protein
MEGSVEEGVDEDELFSSTPCSVLSHFVNRIEEKAEQILKDEENNHGYSDGFLDYSSSPNKDDDEFDFSFNMSLTSIADNFKTQQTINKGFQKMNTIDDEHSNEYLISTKTSIHKTQLDFKKGNRLEFIDESDALEMQTKKVNFIEDHLNWEISEEPKKIKKQQFPKKSNENDFIGIFDENETLTVNKKSQKKNYPDFDNIFEEKNYHKVRYSNNQLPMRNEHHIRKSFHQKTFYKRKIPERQPKKILICPDTDNLLPDFDNSISKPKQTKKQIRSDSIDFLS